MREPTLAVDDLHWLTGLARAVIGASEADDLAQDTMVAALASGTPVTARRPWLAAVARRLAARRFRDRARQQRRERQAARPEALPDDAELVERAEVAEQVTAAARSLPEPFRRTILLRFLEELTPDEIARREGHPVDTVRWRTRRGLELLREQLVRSGDRDWSQWCALLLPLARPQETAAVGLAAAAGTATGSVALSLWMNAKVLAAVLIVALGGAAWWVSSGEPENLPLGDTGGGPLVAAGNTARLDAASDLERSTVAAAPRASVDTPPEDGPRPYAIRTRGYIRDSEGRPIAGASIYVIHAETGELDTVTKSSKNGYYNLYFTYGPTTGRAQEFYAGKDFPTHVGFAANGFLRQVIRDTDKNPLPPNMDVTLERGDGLWGLVLDPQGRAVPDVSLLAYTKGARVEHVSQSAAALRGEEASLAGPDSMFHSCRAMSDGQGRVAFAGLPRGQQVTVRSLDPGWRLRDPTESVAGGPYAQWTLERTLGLQLEVEVGPYTGEPLPSESRAVIKCRVRFADGEEDDLEQWIGRGEEAITFSLNEEVLPSLAGRRIVRAQFYGTVRCGDVEAEWESAALEDPNGVYGVAQAEVTLQPGRQSDRETKQAIARQAELEVPKAPLELTVQYADGSYFADPIYVDWISQPDRGKKTWGGDRPTQLSPGLFRIELPAGEVDLEVSEANPSGSLPPWTGTVRLDPDRIGTAMVTLPAAAGVTLLRPEGWTGRWYIHASYRESEDDEWFGSWNYSSPDAQWELNAMQPATWRFRLRQDPDQDLDEAIEVQVNLQAGERKRVQA